MTKPKDPSADPGAELELSEAQVLAISRVLADPRRYRMLAEISAARAPLPCCALEATRDVSAATVSHHMKELEAAGLVEVVREGRFANLSFRRPVYEAYLRRLARL